MDSLQFISKRCCTLILTKQLILVRVNTCRQDPRLFFYLKFCNLMIFRLTKYGYEKQYEHYDFVYSLGFPIFVMCCLCFLTVDV